MDVLMGSGSHVWHVQSSDLLCPLAAMRSDLRLNRAGPQRKADADLILPQPGFGDCVDLGENATH